MLPTRAVGCWVGQVRKMIPDYQTLMGPVLESASAGEVKIRDVVAKLADTFGLTLEEREELLPSGKQQKFDNRVHWAKTYLKQAGLLEIKRRGYFKITDRGKQALAEAAKVDTSYLEQFQEFKDFRSRGWTGRCSDRRCEPPRRAAVALTYARRGSQTGLQ